MKFYYNIHIYSSCLLGDKQIEHVSHSQSSLCIISVLISEIIIIDFYKLFVK